MSERRRTTGTRGGPPLVVLLSRGAGEYRRSVRGRLQASGFDDLPRSSSWVLTTLVQGPAILGQLAARLGTTKQALSRLSEALVDRGYLRRNSDPSDHRLVRLSLTAHGRAAAECIVAAVNEVDQAVERRTGRGGKVAAEQALRLAFSDAERP
ncbi:MAG: MarR family winged helix-turn-helix transcriptional regulator [Candidatus Dormibacteria bacterium]